MKLHYKGKYDMNPESLPCGEHMPGAVQFKEVEDTNKLGVLANIMSILIFVILAIPVFIRCRPYLADSLWQVIVGAILSILLTIPHEILHAICFKEDVYLYTNLSQGLLFVVGPETMSKFRFIFMSLCPNIVFGFIPYIIGLLFPNLVLLATLGALCISMGAADYYNVYNAITQMPRKARTYLYQFHSYWYIP